MYCRPFLTPFGLIRPGWPAERVRARRFALCSTPRESALVGLVVSALWLMLRDQRRRNTSSLGVLRRSENVASADLCSSSRCGYAPPDLELSLAATYT